MVLPILFASVLNCTDVVTHREVATIHLDHGAKYVHVFIPGTRLMAHGTLETRSDDGGPGGGCSNRAWAILKTGPTRVPVHVELKQTGMWSHPRCHHYVWEVSPITGAVHVQGKTFGVVCGGHQ